MKARYERNVPALTEAECEALRRKRVLVVGCGGLGGHLIEMLARIGIGALRVVDGDVFEPSNLNRQLLSEVSTLGLSKAKAAAARVSRVPARQQTRDKAVRQGAVPVLLQRESDRHGGVRLPLQSRGGCSAEHRGISGESRIDPLQRDSTVCKRKIGLQYTPIQIYMAQLLIFLCKCDTIDMLLSP